MGGSLRSSTFAQSACGGTCNGVGARLRVPTIGPSPLDKPLYRLGVWRNCAIGLRRIDYESVGICVIGSGICSIYRLRPATVRGQAGDVDVAQGRGFSV